MGAAVAAAFPEVATQYFERADDVLRLPLSRMCFQGPVEELVKTENQQPAIFLVSCAIAHVLRGYGFEPAATAGHSLGEYSALVTAGSLSFAGGLRLARRRGELMAAVAARTGGLMAAVVGLDAAEVEDACAQARYGGVVEIANYNSPSQTVISGEEQGVRYAMELVREMGARRVVELKVSAPFHCSLMADMARDFEPVLEETTMNDAELPVVANVDADYERSVHRIRRNLLGQLDHAVRWSDSMRRLITDGVDTVIEVGPERVLTGLMRQIDSSVTTYSTGDPAGIEKAVQGLSPRLKATD